MKVPEHVQTVSEFSQSVKTIIESNFKQVAIQGEVSNFKKQSSGHLYFSLKDSGAQISAVMWRGMAGWLKILPKDGDQLIVCGELNLYPPRGQYQVVVREVYHVGLGELLIKLEELKREIAKRGWFRPEHKKPLPKFPKKLGLITSPTGAAIRDVLQVLDRRHANFHLILNPVRVQGDEAAGEVASAIDQMNAHKLVDVIIMCRGGGSLEDLWAFNEEVVAKAVFESEIPIIAAIGHESDHTIAEYVADIRAATPSAAAEIVMAEAAQHLQFLEQSKRRLTQTLSHLLAHAKEKLARFESHPYMSSPYQLLGPWMQACDERRTSIDAAMKQRLQREQLRLSGLQKQALALNPSAQILRYRERLMQFRIQTDRIQKEQLKRHHERLKQLVAHLMAIDPKNLLKKGYSILFAEKTGAVIDSIHKLTTGDQLKALLADGQVKLEVR